MNRQELVKKMYDNRDHILKELEENDGYFVHQQKEDMILVRNHKALVGNFDTPIDWTIVLIEGGIWQYNFTNRQVRERSIYVPVEEAIKQILEDSGL